jgi:proton-translocating NAD(P)+ transhydrogenase subunit alpha
MRSISAFLPSSMGRGRRAATGEGLQTLDRDYPLTQPSPHGRGLLATLLAGAVLLLPSAAWASPAGGIVDPFVFRLSIFVLAIFVGYYVVWSVTPALHTPLMSVTNAISSVIVVGALLAVAVEAVGTGADGAAVEGASTSKIFGFLALTMASVNIFGGFLVTQRMLAMYKKKEKK